MFSPSSLPLAIGVYVALCLSWTLHAAEYFVSPTGSNSNPGTLAEPFATVAHGLSIANYGDTVRLERGAVFRESGLTINNGRTLSDYGDSELPRPSLQGSVAVSGWVAWPQNTAVYTAHLPGLSGPVVGVYVNNARATLARYPNEGWLFTDNNNRNVIIDSELTEHPDAAAGRWNGANVRWRKWSWWYETRLISNDNGNGTLTLNSLNDAGQTEADSGFYIDNSLAELDAENEWFWDPATETLYYYPPEGQNPSALQIEAVVKEQALTLNTAVVLENITMRFYKTNVVSINGKSTMRGCLIENIAENRYHGLNNNNVMIYDVSSKGLQGSWGAGGSLVQNNEFRDILGVAMAWNENFNGPTGTVIEGNIIERAGIVPGLGGSGVWKNGGIYVTNGNGTVVRRNRINGAGYGGIVFGSDGLTAEQNVIINAMATLNDGAAIYCNAGENIIRENIILDTQGDHVSTQPWTPLSHGIWVEFLEEFRDSQIVGNTVHGSGCHGIFLSNNFDNVISDNTLFSNRNRGIHLGGTTADPETGLYSQGHLLENNIFAIGAVGWQGPHAYENFREWPEVHLAAFSYNHSDTINMDYGTMSGSVFVHPVGTQLIYRDWSYRSIAQWQSEEPEWADPSPTVVTGNAFLFINDTDATVEFPLPPGITWQQLGGGSAGASPEIEPYQSLVLIASSGDISGMSDVFLASEIGDPEAGDPNPVVSHFFSLLQNNTDQGLDFPLDPAAGWLLPDGTDPGPFVHVRARHSRVLLNNPGTTYFYYGSTLPKSFTQWIGQFGLPGSQQQTDDDPSGNTLTNAAHYFFGIPATSNAMPAMQIASSSQPGEWTFRFPRNKFQEDTSYTVSICEDPHEQSPLVWTNLSSFTEAVTADPEDAYIEWVQVTFSSLADHAWVRVHPVVTDI